MTLFKLRVPSKRSKCLFEIFRLELDDPINDNSFKQLIDRVELVTGVGSNQTIICWSDGSDDCSIRNVNDLKDAVKYHKSRIGRNECILLKIQLIEASPDEPVVVPVDIATVTRSATIPTLTAAAAPIPTSPVPASPSSPTSPLIPSCSRTDPLGSPTSECSPTYLPSYSQVTLADSNIPMDPPAYQDVAMANSNNRNGSNKQVRRSRTTTTTTHNTNPFAKYARVAQKSHSGSCPNLFKPPSPRPVYFFHPHSLGMSSSSCDRNLGKSKRKTLKKLAQTQSMRQTQSEMRQQQQSQTGRPTISEEKVLEIERQLQEMGFTQNRSTIEQTIRSCGGDLNRIVDSLGCAS